MYSTSALYIYTYMYIEMHTAIEPVEIVFVSYLPTDTDICVFCLK